MKIALICAHPSGTNSGMISVDAAFNTVQRQLPDSVEVTRFCSWRSLSKGETLKYNHYYSQQQLEEFDLIIFWGDFLQWIGYATKDWIVKSKKMNINLSDQEIVDQWYSLYLLEGNQKLQQKSLIVGSTIYGLNATQLADVRYYTALGELIKNSKLTIMRDIVSANFVSLMDPSKSNTYGCDCSFFFEPYYFTDLNETETAPYFLYSFSRSGEKETLNSFVELISNKTNLEAKHIPWIHKGAGLDSLELNVNLIRKSKFVITDIYHLSINSWREHVPAVCIGLGNSYVDNSLSDKKKEVLYQQIFGFEHYLFLEKILASINDAGSIGAIVDDCVRLVNDQESNNVIFQYIEQQKNKSLTNLINTIYEQLGISK